MIQSFYSLLYNQEKWKHTSTEKLVNTNVHSSTIHHCQKLEPTKHPSTDETENVIYPYNGYKKEWSSDINYKGLNLEKHNKWKKPVTKDHVLYHSIHMRWSEKKKLEGQKVN